jgi:hypothetical protein
MKNTLKSNSNHDPKQATFDEQVKITTWQFKLFSVILDKKIFSRSCEKLKISCYLVIISNLILNLLTAIFF